MYFLAVIFYIYSFLGWGFEVTRTATKQKHFVNKGFLNGPLCPNYGLTMIVITLCLHKFQDKFAILLIGSTFFSMAGEYIASFILEKLTGSKWWDYSDMPLHINGRTNVFWGALLGLCYSGAFYLNQFLTRFLPVESPKIWQWVLLGIVTFFLLVDYVAAIVTVLSIQSKFRLFLKLAAKLRKVSKRIGNFIFEDTSIRMMQKEIRKENARIRNTYRKEREQKMLRWLKHRMILAAPDMAPDEKTLQRIERTQRNKKRKLFRRIMLNRVLFTGIALIAQIIWLAVLLTRFSQLSSRITLAMTVLSFLISIFVYTKNENSAYKISWIMIIMGFPVFGGLLYVFFGNKNPSRKMRAQMEKVQRENSQVLRQQEEIVSQLTEEDERIAGRSRYLYKKSNFPIWKNTKTQYYSLGDYLFEDFLTDLKKAEHFIFLEFFIIEDGLFWGSILEILKEKAREGVDVRLIYDDIGCLTVLPKKYDKEMEAAGISCMVFNPFKPVLSLAMNNRDHRKIAVIDGKIAYTGGVNLADEYINVADRFGHWKDTAMRFQGDGVANFTVMFLEMWNAFRKTDEDFSVFLPSEQPSEEKESLSVEEENGKESLLTQRKNGKEEANLQEEGMQRENSLGYVQPFGDTPLDDEPTAENLYIDILNHASKYVYIFTPYLIISDTMRHALCMAAARGVDVKIMTPGIPDKKIIFRMTRSNYKELLKAGVEIYEYTPGFLHAKSYVSDDESAVVGTINMDYRSLYLHFECGAYLYKTPTVMDVKNDFLETLKRARKIELKFLRQGLLAEIFDSILAIISPLV